MAYSTLLSCLSLHTRTESLEVFASAAIQSGCLGAWIATILWVATSSNILCTFSYFLFTCYAGSQTFLPDFTWEGKNPCSANPDRTLMDANVSVFHIILPVKPLICQQSLYQCSHIVKWKIWPKYLLCWQSISPALKKCSIREFTLISQSQMCYEIR